MVVLTRAVVYNIALQPLDPHTSPLTPQQYLFLVPSDSPISMRLLQPDGNGDFSLVERLGNNIPPYAILSHTWGLDNDEVTFQDVMSDRGRSKPGYDKVRFCGEQAVRDGL